MLNWSDPTWSYLLGVVHGDGHLSKRSIEIAVGYKDEAYLEVLKDLWVRVGCNPKVYRGRTAFRLDIHRLALVTEFQPFKSEGIWSWPTSLAIADYVAGVFDTDGSVSRPELKAISIGLKRSGNLNGLVPLLVQLGIREPHVVDSNTKFKGTPYEIETIKLSGMDRILTFSEKVRLRNPRKQDRLEQMRQLVLELQANVPLWRQVAAYMREEPRTWAEIAEQFNLTKRQVDSLLQSIREFMDLEVIPPPKLLTRYRAKDRS